jgi:hypothetical protein
MKEEDAQGLERGLEVGARRNCFAPENAIAHAFSRDYTVLACSGILKRFCCYVTADQHNTSWIFADRKDLAVCAFAGFEQAHRQCLTNLTLANLYAA